MALREIRIEGDPILKKVCKPVTEVNDRIRELIDDMLDTMYEANGVGLAAPQVGILKRIFVIDVSEEGNEPHVFINPKIIKTSGSQTGDEGCLSIPGKTATVTRALNVVVRAFDENMEEFELEGEGLMARAIQHENDHLNGRLYVEIAEGPVRDLTLETKD
ncbi:MAG: peptide deformylase [Lachnospiraceae bacterium]|nr:peptide deformylase [Lachnospiraceae bacterium]